MGHKCTYSDKLVYDSNEKQFYRSITAYWKDKTLEIAKIYEDGRAFGRYLTFTYCGGYCIDFPGEKVRSRYSRETYIIEEDDEFEQIWWNFNLWVGSSNIDKEYIVEQDPSLKYLISKFNGTRNDILLPIIATYRNYPEIEPLVEMGLYKLASDKRLHKLSKAKKKEVINFVKDNYVEGIEMELTKIFTCVKNKIKYSFYDTFISCKDESDLFKYLVKQNQTYTYYVDYKEMAIKAGHDFNQEYWKYPKNLVEAHNKVMAECKNIDDANDAILAAQFNLVSSDISKNYIKIIEGYTFYIPSDYKDFARQAEELKQCLITGGYVKKMIEQKSILIFIKEGEKRIGTIEIDYKKKILQAYGNESDRKNCTLSKEIMDFAKLYIGDLKLRKKKYKANPKVFYKGLYSDDKSFNGLSFETNKIYDTGYPDNVINEFGSKCMTTNKVFHFCKTFDDVKGWVTNPSTYAIVEALGPVVNKGTAYGSNKIKIKKIMTLNDVARALLETQNILINAY